MYDKKCLIKINFTVLIDCEIAFLRTESEFKKGKICCVHFKYVYDKKCLPKINFTVLTDYQIALLETESEFLKGSICCVHFKYVYDKKMFTQGKLYRFN